MKYTGQEEAQEYLKSRLSKRDIIVPPKVAKEIQAILDSIPPSSMEEYGETDTVRAANYYEVYIRQLEIFKPAVTKQETSYEQKQVEKIGHHNSNSTHKILGNDFQVVEFELHPMEEIYASPGSMLYMDNGIKMKTKSGGVFNAMKRKMAGEGAFISSFQNEAQENKKIALASGFPGAMLSIDLSKTRSLYAKEEVL